MYVSQVVVAAHVLVTAGLSSQLDGLSTPRWLMVPAFHTWARLYLCLAHDEVLLVCHLTPAVGSMDFYLLVIALALQLQTILGEQLASDDQAADVVDIGTVISLGEVVCKLGAYSIVQRVNGVSTHLAGLTSVVVALLTFSVRYNVGVSCGRGTTSVPCTARGLATTNLGVISRCQSPPSFPEWSQLSTCDGYTVPDSWT